MLRKDQMQSKHTNLWEFWNLTSNAGFTPHACCLPEFCDELVPRGLAPFPWSCSFGFKQFQYASQAKNRNIQKTNNLTVPISVCIHAFSKRHMTTLAPGTRYSAQNVFPIFFKLFLSPSTLMLRCCESRSLAGGEFSCMNCKIYACCDEIDVTFGWIKCLWNFWKQKIQRVENQNAQILLEVRLRLSLMSKRRLAGILPIWLLI